MIIQTIVLWFKVFFFFLILLVEQCAVNNELRSRYWRQYIPIRQYLCLETNGHNDDNHHYCRCVYQLFFCANSDSSGFKQSSQHLK